MKTAELKNLIKFSSEKMQMITVFKSKHLHTELACFESGQAQKSSVLADQDRSYFILEGKARFTVGRTTREYEAGTAIHVNAGQEHGIINISEQKMIIFVSTSIPPKKK